MSLLARKKRSFCHRPTAKQEAGNSRECRRNFQRTSDRACFRTPLLPELVIAEDESSGNDVSCIFCLTKINRGIVKL